MQRVPLAAKPRTALGKQGAKKLRAQGYVPGILYGHGMQPMPFQVVDRELLRVLHTKAGANVLIDLNVEGMKLKEGTCRIKEIQHNPVTDEVSHLDFTVISLTEKIQVNVPLLVPHQDDIEGIKQGGILDIVHHEIPIECLPTAIPEKFELNLKNMKIGDSVHAKDLALPEGVALAMEPNEVIVAMHAPKKEEEVKEEGIQQPEVIEKGKKEEVEGEGKEVKKPEAAAKEAKQEKPAAS